MATSRSVHVDVALLALAILPSTAFALSGSLQSRPTAGLLLLVLLLLATLWAPFQRARGKTVAASVYTVCWRAFFVLTFVLVFVGLFGVCMSLLLTLFPPQTVIRGRSVPTMPIAQVFASLVAAGGLAAWVCRAYSRRPDQLWRRLADSESLDRPAA